MPNILAKHTHLVNVEVDDATIGTALLRIVSERLEIPYNAENVFLTNARDDTFLFSENNVISNDSHIAHLVNAANVLIDGEPTNTDHCESTAPKQIDFVGATQQEIASLSITECKNKIGAELS